MKLTNVLVNGEKRLARIEEGKVYLLKTSLTMDDVLKQGNCQEMENAETEIIEDPVYANLVESEKIICVGLNYPKHTAGIKMKDPDYPVLFSKFRDALIPEKADIIIHSNETTANLLWSWEKELSRLPRKKPWIMYLAIQSATM